MLVCIKASKIQATQTSFDSYLGMPAQSNLEIAPTTTCAEIKNLLMGTTDLTYTKCQTKYTVISPYLLQRLSRLFNLPLSSGIFPAIFKNDQIVPVHKTGSIDNPSYYCPILLLPTLSKLLKKVVKCQFIDYHERHNILTHNQLGFCKKKFN